MLALFRPAREAFPAQAHARPGCFSQAPKFGAELAIPLEVTQLECGAEGTATVHKLRLGLTTGRAIRARTVVIASGIHYRRPDIPNLSIFEGASVSYRASAVEAKLCEGEEVALVGARAGSRSGRVPGPPQ